MLKRLHLTASMLALFCIATFFLSTILVETMGARQSIAQLKHLIVSPGLWVLIPTMVLAGASGMLLSRSRQGRLVGSKKKRMPFISANGLLVLVPCAIALNVWAATGRFDTWFYIVQVIELIAGAVNLTLMGLNVRDGLRLSGRLQRAIPHGR
jgi:flagellar biosynthesis component FlhA